MACQEGVNVDSGVHTCGDRDCAQCKMVHDIACAHPLHASEVQKPRSPLQNTSARA